MIEQLYDHYLQHPQVCTDTRKLTPGCIFFALKGPSFNGNAFAKQALAEGASMAVIDEEEFSEGEQYFLVKDVLSTLQQLANHHRRSLDIPFIGITGSNGKTTTKEFIREVLSKKYNTLATEGNLNNHIGVPLTLLSITSDTEIAVIEMGANHPGNIEELCDIAEPNFGIITNIGKAHIEGFGSFQGVINTKNELYQSIQKQGKLIFINAENELLMDLAKDIKQIRYGSKGELDLKGSFVGVDPFLKLSWSKDDYSSNVIESNLIGAYNFENILAAICIGHHFGVPAEKINEAIEGYVPANNRSQIEKTEHNTLILDAYNANPTSMAAAIENFSLMDATNKFFVLGDMLELGEDSPKEHQAIVELLLERGLKEGILVGKEFQAINSHGITTVANNTEAQAIVNEKKLEEHLILIKGSRGIRLETVAPLL